MQVSLRKFARQATRTLNLLGKTPNDLERKTGLSHRTVRRILTGQRQEGVPFVPSYPTAVKVQRALDQWSKNS